MKLKYMVTTLDGIEDHLHDCYIEKDGKFYLDVEGVKTPEDVTRLQNALAAEKAAHKATKEAFKPLDGLDLSEVVAKLDTYDELKTLAEGKTIDEAKLNEMVEKRIASRIAPLEREKAKFEKLASELESKVGEFKQKDITRIIHDKIRAACVDAKVIPSAIDDVLLLGERVLTYDEELAQVITRDGVGVTPGADPTVWLSEMQEKRSHWWPATVGTGANGGGRGDGTLNPFTADNWNLTAQGSLIKSNSARADQLAKAAGTYVGGPKPVKK